MLMRVYRKHEEDEHEGTEQNGMLEEHAHVKELQEKACGFSVQGNKPGPENNFCLSGKSSTESWRTLQLRLDNKVKFSSVS